MSTLKYDFDTIPDRENTGSLKWDRYAGKEILPFWVADMDFRSAPEIQEALRNRVDHGVYGYTLAPKSTVEAVQSYLESHYSWKVKDEEILWLPGLVPALNIAVRAFCKEDEEVVIASPVYPPFRTAPENAGRKRLEVPMIIEKGRWVIDFDFLEQNLSNKSKLFILCNPHNPGGTVLTREELIRLGEICQKRGMVICSDEIHCDLILNEEQKHTPYGTLPEEFASQSITLMAPSKTYNLPGLGCAFGVFPNEQLRTQFSRTARGLITEINLFGYAACEAAYRYGEPWRKQMIAYLRGNRDHLYQILSSKYPEVKVQALPATYLAWLDFRHFGVQSFASHFEKHGIGLTDGVPFGGKGFMRMNFACPRTLLDEGLNRLTRGIEALREQEGK